MKVRLTVEVSDEQRKNIALRLGVDNRLATREQVRRWLEEQISFVGWADDAD